MKNVRKQIFLCGIIFTALFFAVDAKAFDVAAAYKELSVAGLSADGEMIREISRIPDKPHFLLGFGRKYTKWDQFQELRKMYITAGNFYQPAGNTFIDRKASEYNTDNTLQEVINIEGKKIQIVYLGYHEINGMTFIWVKLGEKNLAEFSPAYEKYKVKWALGVINDLQWSLIQKFMGWAQFEAVKSYVHSAISESAKESASYYKNFDFVKRIMEVRTKVLGDSEYTSHINDNVIGDIKVGDIVPTPRVEVVDFLPDIFFVGLGKFEGGLAYWKVNGSEKIVYVSMQSLMHDYISGNNHITRHEFIHVNSYLQSLVYSLYFDVEIWAEMATGFLEADPMDYLRHPYYAHWRDLAKIYFGYDSEEVARRIFPGGLSNAGVKDVDKKEFENNAEKIKLISNEMKKFIGNFLVDFYAEPFFWTGINTKFCDTAAALRISFALNYKSAGLFDPNKKDKSGKVISPSVQTELWLIQEEESGKLDRLAEYAMKNTGIKSNIGAEKEMSKFSSGNLKCPVNSVVFLVSKKEREEIVATFEFLANQAKAGNGLAKYALMRFFGNTDLFIAVKSQ